jgi:hypothetical protein
LAEGVRLQQAFEDRGGNELLQTLKSRDDARRMTEVAIAVKSLNRMRDLEQAICVRLA